MPDVQVAVIGAGPAGITCAVQLVREGIKTVLIERDKPGGIIRMAHRVENCPAFYPGIAGEQIADKLSKHLDDLNIKYTKANVRRIMSPSPFKILLAQNQQSEADHITAECVVLACGLEHRQTDFPAEISHAIHYGSKLPEKHGASVLIIGSGDVAFDQATRLSKAGYKVTLTHRKSRLKALPLVIEYAKEAGIEPILSAKPVWKVSHRGIIREDLLNQCFDYIMPCIGRVVRNPVILSENGRIAAEAINDSLETACKGVFVAGDICRGRQRQVTIAMGDGMRVALEIAERYKSVHKS